MQKLVIPIGAMLGATLLFAGTTPVAAQATGIIRGQVTEADTKAAIPAAQITLTGTKLGTTSRNDGSYTITVAPGSYTVRVARIGYEPQSRAVTVSSGDAVAEDFALAHTAARLDEVVTTATGEFERKAVPNVVANVSADSVFQVAAVRETPDLLQGRVAGLYVQTPSGVTGSGPAIRIRGISSLSLNNEPLLIIDGVRVDDGAQQGNLQGYAQSKFADFTGDDIESIDVIKGPSAAALYGTAAGAGVIVIKTKHGSAGKTSWRVWGEEGPVQQTARYPDNYYSWAHTSTPGHPVQCTISNAALGKCTIDSLTTFNPMNDPATRPYHDENQWKSGVQATGGLGTVTYYAMAEALNETGPYAMPASEIARITALRGTAPSEEELHPNALRQTNLRGNFSVPISDNANLTLQTGYIDKSLRTPFGDGGGYFAGLTLQMVTAPGYKTAFNGNGNQYTGDIFGLWTQQSTQRLTTSSTLTWTPIPWLNTRATVGLDQDNTYGFELQQNGQGPNGGWGNVVGQNGGKVIQRSNYSKYSTDLGANTTWQYRPNLTFKTAVGVQYFRDENYTTSAQAYDLPVGATQTSAGARQTTQESTNENATYGAYVQEDAVWRNDVFFKAGARTDKNSAFGFKQGTAVYPNLGASWVLSDESFFPKVSAVNSVRLRTSWGRAGVQPAATAAIPYFTAGIGPVAGVNAPYISLGYLGNPNLKPEITTEIEYGLDADLFNRVNFEFTYFNKQSHDAIINAPLPYAASAGSTEQENLGQVQNRGVELGLDVNLLNSRPLYWNVRLTGDNINNKIVSMGGVPITYSQGQVNAPGYPVYSWWAYPINGYTDSPSHPGVITPDGVTVGNKVSYCGPAVPPRDASLSNTFTIFKHLSLSTLMDYHGGSYIAWNMERDRCSGTQNCVAVNLPTEQLDRQAAAVALITPPYNSQWGYMYKADFIKLRELTMSYDLPTEIATRLRSRSAQLVFSGRNVGVMWTKYPGLDPEISYYGAGSITGNNDWFSPPASRYFLVRLNLGL